MATRKFHHKDDDGSLHVLGNGRLCVYEQGHNIDQVFGEPYSAPNFCRLTVDCDSESIRTPGTCIYQHKLKNGAQITDFVDSELPCLVRQIRTGRPFDMRLEVVKPFELLCEREGYVIYRAAPGATVYGPHVTTRYAVMALAWTGDIRFDGSVIRVGPAESCLYFVGSQEYDACVRMTEEILRADIGQMYESTLAYWQTFTQRRRKLPSELEEMGDSVAVLLKAQQSRCGGVLAGHNFHMAYIRDQYGVSRGLLALGYVEEAKQILCHYKRIWEREGRLHNAQGMGVDSIFHRHENDDVEITGYLVIQAFDVFDADGDRNFLDSLLPMLKWAVEKQIANLANDMLPFNGDETYIAGGILPRHTLLHGSAEATLLFIIGTERYCNYTGDRDGFSAIVARVKAAYAHNFIRDGYLMTNNPARLPKEAYPAFRFGVCEQCNDYYWTQKTDNSRYLCPHCFGGEGLPPVEDQAFCLKSVALTPFFLDAGFIDSDQIRSMLDEMIADYRESGKLPSAKAGNRNTGYDYGLFLFALTILGDHLRHEMFRTVISMADSADAWVEYYDDGVPAGTRCRPWESGINIAACIRYLEGENGSKKLECKKI